MLNLAEYQVPPGYYDLPYIHVYDADALTDGANYSNVNLRVTEHDSGFALRQIMGCDKVAARINFRDSFAPLSSAGAGVVWPLTYPVAPERFITPVGALIMDLYTVARANRVQAGQPPVTIYFAQLAIQGARRYQGDGAYPGASDYKYREKPYTYTQTIVVDWAATDTVPRKYAVAMVEGCDFELQRITMVRTQLGGAPSVAIPNCELKLKLFEQYGKELSNAPVLDVYLNDAAQAPYAPELRPYYNGTFPVPGVLYRRMSFLKYEVTSLLTTAMAAPNATAIYDISFHGIRRVAV